tara:strand:- start:171 stop:374 length:204 start_codon:yes stop_codon:yes gene_type:complete
MKNLIQSALRNQNDDYRKRAHAEIQRRFVDLQFKRSELEKQLKRVNEVLSFLGREMEGYYLYDQLNK